MASCTAGVGSGGQWWSLTRVTEAEPQRQRLLCGVDEGHSPRAVPNGSLEAAFAAPALLR